jgi:MFS family permease
MGRLGDLYGKRRMLIASLSVMVIGALISAFTSDVLVMIAGRTLQGFAMGVIPLGIGLMRDLLPRERLGSAMAMMSSSVGVGGSIAMPAAALVAQLTDWHVMFYGAAGLGAVSIALILLVVPESPVRAEGTGTGASGMWLRATRANPEARISTTPPPEISRARSTVVTSAPAAPSAGWVWVAPVWTPPGEAAGSDPMRSRSTGRIPLSSSTTTARLPDPISTGTMYSRWKARSSASARSYWAYRRAATSSSSARVIPCSAATVSAAASIDVPAHGSQAKFCCTTFSTLGEPPGAEVDG